MSLSLLFIAASLVPLAQASTEQTHNGDVIVNGDFSDARRVGHPLKFYCGSNNPTPAGGPNGECAGTSTFVAFDWTAPVGDAPAISLTSSGLRLAGNVFIQQHFSGSEAPDRSMRFFRATIEGQAASAGSGRISVEVRADVNDDGKVEQYMRTITLGTSRTRVDLTAAQLGLPAAETNLRSIRLWAESNADLTLSRVSVYATNGVEGRNIHVLPTGDDALLPMGAAAMLSPGADGKYSFLVGMAADDGDLLPTLDAWLCLYTAEQAFADRGYPSNVPTMCSSAYLRPTSPAITRTRVGDAWRFDVDAWAVRPQDSAVGAFGVYAVIEVDATYDTRTPGVTTEYKSGYLHLGRLAADAADAGVSLEYYGGTPLFVDADANGKPDAIQTQDSDGYSVILTPRRAVETPVATLVGPALDGKYEVDVQVYHYPDASGSPIDLPGSIAFGLFDGSPLVQGTSPLDAPLWRASSADVQRVDAKTWRVRIPASAVPAATPVGAWAFYDVGRGEVDDAVSPFVGPSRSSTDFHSALRNSAKAFAIADAMRIAATPLLFESAAETSTVVIRFDAGSDTLTALDGTLVVDDKGDGTIALEYALLDATGALAPSGTQHGLALYDAAAAASDGFAPGSSGLKHALWHASGTSLGNGWFRVEAPVDAFDRAKGPVGAYAWVDAPRADGSVLSRAAWYNALKPAVAALSPSAAQALALPTPIVVVDDGLGLPKALASALAGLHEGTFDPGNPILNPGFDADLQVEASSSASGAMTAPPWTLRVDDEGGTRSPVARSTHRVEHAVGGRLDHALRIDLSRHDQGRELLLGQLLGSETGGDALVWRGAQEAVFDARGDSWRDLTMGVLVRYHTPSGGVGEAAGSVILRAGSSWTKYTVPLSVPTDARLLSFDLLPQVGVDAKIHLDNVALVGARMSLGDARTDANDGFAVIIRPLELDGAEQSRVQGADGLYYLYEVSVVDHREDAATTIDLAGKARAFALRDHRLQKSVGYLYDLVGRHDTFLAAVPVASVPGQAAAPWAFVEAGEPYATLGSPVAGQPASGYYNPVKNALAMLPVSDVLDAGATPVRFVPAIGSTLAAPQTLALVPVTGGYAVRVDANTPVVATTTLSVTRPTGPNSTYPVSFGVPVPGLVLTEQDLEAVTLTTSRTNFTHPTTYVPGSFFPAFTICRTATWDCTLDGLLTGETLALNGTSHSPAGETLTHRWHMGDRSDARLTGDRVTYTYAQPGTYVLNLTVTSPSGKIAWLERAMIVGNRAPRIDAMPTLPTTIHADSLVTVRAQANDPDHGTLQYAWTLDGAPVPDTSNALLRLTPAILQRTLDRTTLEIKTYEVGVTVTDGQGGVAYAVTNFTVVDRPSTVSTPILRNLDAPSAPHPLVGDRILINVSASDLESTIERVDAEVVANGTLPVLVPLVLTNGAWLGEHTTSVSGLHNVTGIAWTEHGPTRGPTRGLTVKEDAPPSLTITGPALVQAGGKGTYTISATDPDGRGIAGVQLLVNGALVGETTSAATLTLNVTFPTMGVVELTGRATDKTGLSGSRIIEVRVDDTIRVTIDLVQRAQGPTEGHRVRVAVVDDTGAPVAGANVTLEDLWNPFPVPISRQNATTGADGTVEFTLAPEAAVVGLPIDHVVRAHASAASRAGAPVEDSEAASAELRFKNEAAFPGGLVLP